MTISGGLRLTFAACFLIAGQAGALPKTNTIEFSNCTLNLPGTILEAEARCGWLEVPEDPDAPEGRMIQLRVAVAPAMARDPKPDPLFLFAGGPGQAASEAYVMMRRVLEEIRKDRDIVLIDQRGTGQSNPLDCPQQELEDLDQSVDLALVERFTRECLEALDGDPRLYTSTIAMGDYEQVRQAMGYGPINLLGISYGTRTAQVYLRLFPEQVRSVILDSVVPMSLALGEEHARMLDRAVAAVLDDCAADAVCSEHFDVSKADLDALVADLRQSPREISYVHPVRGTTETMTFSADVLAAAFRFLSYSSRTQAVLPLLLSEALEEQRLDRLAGQALLVLSGLSEQLSRGMELSVMCSEDYPFMTDDPQDQDTLMGNLFVEITRAQCEVWTRGEVPPGFHDPVVSDVPVLLMSGTRDPVTPPVYAEETARHFSNHLNLVGKGLGHAVITHHCLREVAAEFIQAGAVTDLDIACVDRIEPAPFFTSLLGPQP